MRLSLVGTPYCGVFLLADLGDDGAGALGCWGEGLAEFEICIARD